MPQQPSVPSLKEFTISDRPDIFVLSDGTQVPNEPSWSDDKMRSVLQRMEAEVRSQSAPPVSRGPVAGRGTGYDPRRTLSQFASETGASLRNNAPLLAGFAAAPFTEGMSAIPAMATMGGAVGTGSALRGDDLKDIALETVFGGVLPEGVGRAIGASGPMMKRGAIRLWRSLAKPTNTALARTGAAQSGRGLNAAANEVAETSLGSNRGVITPHNADDMRAGLTDLDAKLSQVLLPSHATIPRSAIEQALLDESQSVGLGSIAQQTRQHGLDTAFDAVGKLPTDIPIQEAQRIKQQIYAARNYAAGSKDAADAAADKVSGRAWRREIAAAEPATSDINAELSRQIPATKVMDEAVKRVGNRNPVDVTKTIALASLRGPMALPVLLNDPVIGSWIAQKAYNASQHLQGLGPSVSHLGRAALLTLLGGQGNQ